MATNDVKRLVKEIQDLEHQHERLAERFNRAFMEQQPNERALQKELEACVIRIHTRMAELDALRQASGESGVARAKGGSRFTWVLHRRD